MFDITGRIIITDTNWMITKFDDGLGAYYRKLVFYNCKMIKLDPPLNGTHLTVIAGKHEKVKDLNKLKSYHEQKIKISYNNIIETNGESYWLQVKANEELKKIRMSLGLPPTKPISFHLTIGNLKRLRPPKNIS